MLFVAAAGFVSKSADVQVTGRGGRLAILAPLANWRGGFAIKSLAPFLSNWRGGFAHQILGAIFVRSGDFCKSADVQVTNLQGKNNGRYMGQHTPPKRQNYHPPRQQRAIHINTGLGDAVGGKYPR